VKGNAGIASCILALFAISLPAEASHWGGCRGYHESVGNENGIVTPPDLVVPMSPGFDMHQHVEHCANALSGGVFDKAPASFTVQHLYPPSQRDGSPDAR
jgi:hypothetical protein